MANKQDVYNAFYEGVCLVLSDLSGRTGININDMGLDKEELKEYAELNDKDKVLDLF